MTLKGPCDFKLEDFYAAPSELFEPYYGMLTKPSHHTLEISHELFSDSLTSLTCASQVREGWTEMVISLGQKT